MSCQENNQKNCAYESIIYLKKKKKKDKEKSQKKWITKNTNTICIEIQVSTNSMIQF